MIPDDRPSFEAALTALERLLGWRVPLEARPWYHRAVEELPLEAVLGGVEVLIRHFRSEHGRFPRPADLRYYAAWFAADRRREESPMEPRELTDAERDDILASIRHLRATLEDGKTR